MKKFSLVIFVLLIQVFVTFGQQFEADPHRGMYVDKFCVTDQAGSFMPAFSILGNTAREDSLLRFAQKYHFTYIALYGLRNIFGDVGLENQLCSFIQKAKNEFCINQIGAIVGGDPCNLFNCTNLPPLSPQQIAPINLPSNILSLAQANLQSSDPDYWLSENIKLAFHSFMLGGSCQPNNGIPAFDVYSIEDEFWGMGSPAANAAEYNNNFKPFLDDLVQIRNYFNHGGIIEAYLAAYSNGGNSSVLGETIQSITDFIDGTSATTRRADRILMTYYKPYVDSTNENGASDRYYIYSNLNFLSNPGDAAYERSNAFRNTNTLNSTDFHPLFSLESIYNGGGANYFGTWINRNRRNNIFLAEKKYYDQWRGDPNTNVSLQSENKITPGGVMWFSSGFLADQLLAPTISLPEFKLFYSTSPVATTLASAPVQFTYIGPTESGIEYEFRIHTKGSCALVSDPQLPFTGTTGNLIPENVLTVGHPYSTTISLPSITLPVGDYVAELKLTYRGCGVPTYYYQDVSVVNSPTVSALEPLNQCEGNQVTLISSTNGASVITWHKVSNPGIIIPVRPSYISKSNELVVTESGYYYSCVGACNGTGLNGSSNVVHVSFTPIDPPIVTTAGCQTGSVVFSMPAGGTNYQWSWSPTSTNQTITIPTVLTRTIMEYSYQKNGCFKVGSVSFNNSLYTQSFTTFSLSSTPASPITCAQSISLDATSCACGNYSNRQFAWSNRMGSDYTAQYFPSLSSETYSIWYKSGSGCVQKSSLTMTINNTITANYTSVINDACGNTNSISLSSNPSFAATGYTWSGPSGYSANVQNPATITNASYLQAGIYTVTTTGACSAQAAVDVQGISSAYTVPIESSSDICTGEITLTAGCFAQYSTYFWSTGETTSSITVSSSGTYSVTVNDFNGCGSSNNITVTVPIASSPSITATSSSPVCFGTTLTLSATGTGGTGALNYTWFGPNQFYSTFQNPTRNSMSFGDEGDYWVTVTDANGCEASEQVSVLVNSLPDDPDPPTSNSPQCADVGVNLLHTNPPTGVTWFWQTSAAGTSMANSNSPYNVTTSGTYYLRAWDSGTGCWSANSTNITVTVNTNPTVTVSTTNLTCNGANDGQACATANNGTTPYTYVWSCSGTQLNNCLNAMPPANSCSVTVIDANSCSITSSSFNITEPPAISISPSTTPVTCNGGSDGEACANATGGTGNLTYQWSCTTQTSNCISNMPATVGCTVTVTDANSCSLTSQLFDITEPSALSASATISTPIACNGGTGSITASVTGGISPYTYSWNTFPIQTTAIATGLLAGTYELTVTDANGCIDSKLISISEPIALSSLVSATDVTICTGAPDGTATAYGYGGTPPYTFLYTWIGGNTTANPATGLAAGHYTVTVADANGCTSNTDFDIYQLTSFMSVALTPTNATTCTSSDGSISSVVSDGVPPYTYAWLPSGSGANPINLVQGSYTVTVTDASGCTANAQTTVGSSSISVNIVTTNATCTGITGDGTATATPSGGTAPYTYHWFLPYGDQFTQQAINLATGTYQVTVTDATFCSNTVFATVSQNAVAYFRTTYTLSANETWNAPLIKVKGMITIPAGITLEIDNSTVEFSYDNINLGGYFYDRARLVVEPGALLIVNNSILTGCNGGIWDGVQVLGDPQTSQTGATQGTFNIYGSSKIQNAYIGINCQASSLINAHIANSAGGIVTADHVTFENCEIGVRFRDYNFQPSISTFDNCTFSFTSAYPFTLPDDVYGMDGAFISDIDGITFTNTTFQSDPAFFDEKHRGTGIFSDNAGYNLETGGGGAALNNFNDLSQALYARQNSGTNHIINVNTNTFNNNQHSIYLIGADNMPNTFEHNTINVPTSAVGNKNYGMFFVGSSGFYINDNLFTLANGTGALTYGMCFENSGTVGGIVFNNVINSDIDFGIQTQLDNSNLKIRCNTFGDPGSFSCAVVDDGSGSTLLKQQGLNCAPTGGANVNENQAGNEWLTGCTSGVKDIYVDPTVSFEYFAHFLNAVSLPTTRPECSSQTWITSGDLHKCVGVQKTSTSCNSAYSGNIPPPPPVTGYNDYMMALKDAINFYKQLIMQGSPDKKYYLQEIQLLENEMMRQKIRHGAGKDEKKELLKESITLGAKKKLAEMYLAEAKLDSVDIMLDEVDNDTTSEYITENQQFADFLNSLKPAVDDTIPQTDSTEIAIDANETDMSAVNAVAQSNTSVSSKAEVTEQQAFEFALEHAIFDIQQYASRIGATATEEQEENFRVFPNPTNENVTVEFLRNDSSYYHLSIRDALGREVYFFSFPTGSKKTIIDTNNWNNGFYIIELRNSNSVIHQRKLAVIK